MEEEDELRLRTRWLLTEFLEHCAQRPSSTPRPPATPEAVVLRSLAAGSWLGTPHSWSQRQRHRVEQVVDQAEWLVPDGAEPTWFSVLALLSFAGALLECEATVDRDCQRLAAFLGGWLTGRHRAWVEAHGGWDGFCHSFLPVPQAAWGMLLAPLLMSCLIHIPLICLWVKSWLQDV